MNVEFESFQKKASNWNVRITVWRYFKYAEISIWFNHLNKIAIFEFEFVQITYKI